MLILHSQTVAYDVIEEALTKSFRELAEWLPAPGKQPLSDQLPGCT